MTAGSMIESIEPQVARAFQSLVGVSDILERKALIGVYAQT